MSSAQPRPSLPEEFLLLSHHPHGRLDDPDLTALGCALAELGELVLRRDLWLATKKTRLFGLDVYSLSGRIHLQSSAPTGLAWADEILSEVGAMTVSRGGPIRLDAWIRHRDSRALSLHEEALIGRGLLRPSRIRGHHVPDPAVCDTLVIWLQAIAEERASMDERMLFLFDLVTGARLGEHLGVTLKTRQRFDRARGIGAVAGLSEDMRDASTVLSEKLTLYRTRSRGGNGDGGDGGDGGGE
ncbi:GOLPH3/VPS74 family protein [Nocardiopsis alba]|uniref:GOLPH3/VPS74 family protein n=1 Tax=Nocardiopsis alba TaxID=53437 RepID=UPI00034D6E11|nr:GPP34 family phosphoprotein [Nocardiopsis alba]